MQNTTTRRTLIRNGALLSLFGIGLGAVYGPRISSWVSGATPVLDEASFTAIADIDYWQRTARERIVAAQVAFDLEHELAEQVPMVLNGWSGEDKPEDNIEALILLDPEQYVRRLYWDKNGRHIWMSLIGGRSSKPFHPPDICYDADGWQTEMSSRQIPLARGGELFGLWMAAQKTNLETGRLDEHIVFYCYLLPNQERNHADGIVLFKLTSPRYGTLDETLAVHAEIVQALFSRAEVV